MFVKVGPRGAVPPGRGRVFQVGGVAVAVFNLDGRLHAIANACPHVEGPLGEGPLRGAEVVCPWHGWRFDVTNGRCTTHPGLSVQRFEVREEGDDLLVSQAPLAD